MLAQLVAGDTPVKATLPLALRNGGGYPPFHEPNATVLPTATLYFEVSCTFLIHVVSFHVQCVCAFQNAMHTHGCEPHCVREHSSP